MKTILVIEDDAILREDLSDLLGSAGYRVLLAENGHAGLTQLEGSATPPALILLDIMMPVMDGIKFRSAQLQNPKVSKVPVIIMTADGKAPERAAALQACAFVRKPMDIDYLLKAISNHIRSEAHH